jgi:hypothetical protein
MGQYGNQPDFGTIVNSYVKIAGDASTKEGAEPCKGGALYIGTGGTLICTVVGGDESGLDYSIFYNIPDGTFFPIIVTNLWEQASDQEEITTCSNIIVIY